MQRKAIAAIAGVATAAFVLGCGRSIGGGSPGGAWGSIVACLRSHPLLEVSAAGSGGKAPSASTNAVEIWEGVRGSFVAYVGDNGLGADDLTGSGGADVSLVDGPIHYGFTPQADAARRREIENCIQRFFPSAAYGTTPSNPSSSSATTSGRGSYSGKATTSSLGPPVQWGSIVSKHCDAAVWANTQTSCDFARAVFSQIQASQRATRHKPSRVTAYNGQGGHPYTLKCVSYWWGLLCDQPWLSDPTTGPLMEIPA